MHQKAERFMVRTARYEPNQSEVVFKNKIVDSRVAAIAHAETIGQIVDRDRHFVRAFLEGWNGIYGSMQVMAENELGAHNLASIYLIDE